MKFNKLTPNLMVEDVAKNLDYYIDVLGFTFVMGVEPGSQEPLMAYERGTELSFAIMQGGGVELMLQNCDSLAEEVPDFSSMQVGGSFCCYIEMEGIEEFYSRVGGKVDLVFELKTQFYGMREFCFRDCNGYYLSFAERVQ